MTRLHNFSFAFRKTQKWCWCHRHYAIIFLKFFFSYKTIHTLVFYVPILVIPFEFSHSYRCNTLIASRVKFIAMRSLGSAGTADIIWPMSKNRPAVWLGKSLVLVTGVRRFWTCLTDHGSYGRHTISEMAFMTKLVPLPFWPNTQILFSMLKSWYRSHSSVIFSFPKHISKFQHHLFFLDKI